jgi:cell division protein FtsL
MSISRAIPLVRPIAPRRHLRPVESLPKVRAVRESRFSIATQSKIGVAKRLVYGLIAVGLLNLVVSTFCNTAIYSISSLKAETKELATKTQILQQQVDSLRSPQNLANSAKSLGMVVNANSVFLNISTGKVLGAAIPASATDSGSVSANLIANAALISKSNPTKSTSPDLNIPVTERVSPSVKKSNSGFAEVVLPSSGIPASPTH